MQARIEGPTERKPDAALAEIAPRVVNIERARALLGGVSRPHIYRLIARGELRTIKSGARRLVPVAAIDEYLADRESQSA
jgi:excisionase family DNA binding protein